MANDISHGFTFKSKAYTLEQLRSVVRTAIVLDLHRLSYQAWSSDPEAAAEVIERQLRYPLIVRSSSSSEDSAESSGAGKFDSIANISNRKELRSAIDRVFSSYDCDLNAQDELFIQPMAKDIQLCGVALTHPGGADWQYHVIEYSKTGSTDDVTGGTVLPTSLTYIAGLGSDDIPPLLKPVDLLLEELKALTGLSFIDVEFAIDNSGRLYLFQLRPFITKPLRTSQQQSSGTISNITSRVAKFFDVCRQTLTDHPILSVMTDWNPAEMIGYKPRPLAASLYRKLITDMSWAKARHNQGYKDLRGTPLMLQVGGTPYINVAASFTSFIPSPISADMTRVIVSAACSALRADASLHDKVEFRVIPTCYTPGLEAGKPSWLPVAETDWASYVAALRDQTASLIVSEHNGSGTFSRILALRGRRAQGDMTTAGPGLQNILASLNEIAAEEATTFAEVARLAFMFTAYAKSMDTDCPVGSKISDRILYSDDLILKEIQNDLAQLDLNLFLLKHGHVRPGTYEITEPRYDEDFIRYYPQGADLNQIITTQAHDSLTDEDLVRISQSLSLLNLPLSAEDFVMLARKAVAERERVKYEYARRVSDLLLEITLYAEQIDITRDEASYLDIDDLVVCALMTDRPERLLQNLCEIRKDEWLRGIHLRMPEVIDRPGSVLCSELLRSSANFVGTKTIEADLANPTDEVLCGKIILIENADPGFDWLFSRDIAGLITRFGGENSHMAVRARELGLPAAIGAGSLFETIKEHKRVVFNPLNKSIEKIR